MSEKEEKKKTSVEDAEEIKQILGAVSTEVPALIKSILASVFSEEAGRNLGKAAAAFYKELKDGGMPENVAVKMTEDYMRAFTSLGDMLRSTGRHGARDDFGKEIERKVREKAQERAREHETENEDEEDE